ncbi:glycoside hydrolase family 68 protein [Pontibacillus salipaludis]|uniref:glycoside hydrolase family 68 protein n=1 Tax=Pontibacillus salipaludis TaxID=1697394 RepID=UPI0031F1351D
MHHNNNCQCNHNGGHQHDQDGRCRKCNKFCKKFECCLEQSQGATPSAWTRQQAEQIRITSANAAPIIEEPFEDTAPDLWVWDTWPLREKDGSIAVLPGGWRVIFSLTAPRSVLPGKRHDIATIRYFYARDGQDWIPGGVVFPEGDALGSRQWAGSAFVENGEIFFFYTATGRRNEAQVTYEQRMAFAKGEVFSDLNGVLFNNWEEHSIILVPDGEFYQTQEQSSGGIIYSFRDPWYWIDPESGCEYIIFEGNTATPQQPIDRECNPENIGDGDFRSGNDVPDGSANFNGNVGVALLRSSDYREWELLPPILEADCVNQQLERPHIVYVGGRYHLFIVSHKFTFAPGLDGPDGLYGFVANDFRGNYVPLGEGGLVVANPPEEPFQAYSWIVLPDLSTLSFINYYNLDGVSLDQLPSLPDQFIFNRFGGTLAPTLQLSINGTETQIVNELAQGLVMESSTESAPFTPRCERDGNCGGGRRGRGNNSVEDMEIEEDMMDNGMSDDGTNGQSSRRVRSGGGQGGHGRHRRDVVCECEVDRNGNVCTHCNRLRRRRN